MCGRNNSRTSQIPVLPIGSDTPETTACWPVRVTNDCVDWDCAQDFLFPRSSQGCFQCPEPFYLFHFSRVTPEPVLRCCSPHALPTFLLVPFVTPAPIAPNIENHPCHSSALWVQTVSLGWAGFVNQAKGTQSKGDFDVVSNRFPRQPFASWHTPWFCWKGRLGRQGLRCHTEGPGLPQECLWLELLLLCLPVAKEGFYGKGPPRKWELERVNVQNRWAWYCWQLASTGDVICWKGRVAVSGAVQSRRCSWCVCQFVLF